MRALPRRPSESWGPSGRSRWGASLRWHDGNGSQLHPLADARLHVDDRVLRPAADLVDDALRAKIAAAAVGEDDGADHRDEEDEPRAFEDVEVARVEHPAERLDIGDALRRRRDLDAL